MYLPFSPQLWGQSILCSTCITLKAQNSKSYWRRISLKYMLENCAFYTDFSAVFMLISAPFGKTLTAEN